MISRRPSIRPSYAELAELLRFAVVGVLIAAIYFGLFVSLSQTQLSPIVVNAVSFGIAVAVQYVLQSKWTFKKDAADTAQAGKFLVTISFGFLLSTAISGFVGPFLQWSAPFTAAAVVVIVTVSNFLLFKIWVFTRK